MAPVVILLVQLAVGAWAGSVWHSEGVADLPAVMVLGGSVLGGSVLVGVPATAGLLVARLRPPRPVLARVAVGWTLARLVLVPAVTAAIVVATDPGPDGGWVMSWEVIVLALLEIGVSYALAKDTAKTAQRRTQVYAP
ncbi:hypothetical protein [Virgisporangium ochraceum]|uniref:Uncharacterized protein n=1 Tax=Virgisporangium ochraceum TaxID=65505 RepID=A0A8J4A1Z1_9ACTN|nr:hypothetical protein [Virgisporangium ochraceum]GIJ73338.1 hypothetical protein Voc01_082550 [Virgisporangium ochraceum]